MPFAYSRWRLSARSTLVIEVTYKANVHVTDVPCQIFWTVFRGNDYFIDQTANDEDFRRAVQYLLCELNFNSNLEHAISDEARSKGTLLRTPGKQRQGKDRQ